MMKKTQVFKSLVVASVCALAVVAAVGCSSGSASSSASASSASASSAASSSAASSESASSEAASSEASSEAASSEAASSESASASASAAASSEAASQQAGSASAASLQDKIDAAKTLGFQVFEGTVRVCNAEELIALQAADIDPAVLGSSGTYAVLVFDQPTDVTGMSADGTGARTESSKMLGIAEYTDYGSFVNAYGDLDKCKSLDGQHVTIAASENDIMFPSDVRLPIAEPSASKIEFLS